MMHETSLSGELPNEAVCVSNLFFVDLLDTFEIGRRLDMDESEVERVLNRVLDQKANGARN